MERYLLFSLFQQFRENIQHFQPRRVAAFYRITWKISLLIQWQAWLRAMLPCGWSLLQNVLNWVYTFYSLMEHLFIHLLFFFIQIYSSILKFYCKGCIYLIIKYPLLVSEDEETEHKIYSLFFLNFKFFQTHCSTIFLKHFLAAFLLEWGCHKCKENGWMPCNCSLKPGLKGSTVTAFLWSS